MYSFRPQAQSRNYHTARVEAPCFQQWCLVFLNHRLCTLESPFLVLQVTHAMPGRRSRALNTITPVDSPLDVEKLLGAYVASSPPHDCRHEAAELAQLVGTSERMHAKYSKI